MENTLIIALYFVKNYFFLNFVYYIIFGCFAFLSGLILLTLLFKVLLKKNFTLKFYNLCFLISSIIYFNAILLEFLKIKRVFKDGVDLVISLSLFIILGALGKIIINSFRFKSKKSKMLNLVNTEILPLDSKPKSVEIISCIEEPTTVYNGYVDVKYLKSLIEDLKRKELEDVDEKKIEEFEVYLLNFVNRQPNSIERTKLGEYIGDLIKKLAKYQVV